MGSRALFGPGLREDVCFVPDSPPPAASQEAALAVR